MQRFFFFFPPFPHLGVVFLLKELESFNLGFGFRMGRKLGISAGVLLSSLISR
jgi:hypothetical protein